METISDIVREMRERAEAMQIHGTTEGVKRTVKEFASRIEAAHERELVPNRNKLADKTVTDCNYLNGAKMREALKYLRDASREFCHLILNSKHNEIFDKYKHAEVAKIRDAIANAGVVLAAPARNCDVGTVREQEERFMEFCGHCNCKSCKLTIDGISGDCEIVWAQMPYEEGGAK